MGDAPGQPARGPDRALVGFATAALVAACIATTAMVAFVLLVAVAGDGTDELGDAVLALLVAVALVGLSCVGALVAAVAGLVAGLLAVVKRTSWTRPEAVAVLRAVASLAVMGVTLVLVLRS